MAHEANQTKLDAENSSMVKYLLIIAETACAVVAGCRRLQAPLNDAASPNRV